MLILCVLVFTLLAGLLLIVFGLVQLFADGFNIAMEYPLYPVGVILLTISAMLTPFAVLKIKSFGSSVVAPVVKNRITSFRLPVILSVLIVIWAVILPTGYFLITQGVIASILMPVLVILGILLPISVYLIIAHCDTDSMQYSRGWGALSTGLTITPLVGILLEFGFFTLLFIFIMIVVMQNASFLSELEITATRLSSGQNNPEIFSNMITSFVRKPVNLFLIFSIISGFIPVIEEVVKQIPVWLLFWRKLTPRAGFMIGALGGAGFALTESLMSAASVSGSDQWLFLIIGRAGTGLMHVITGAMGGWGLASSFQGKSYLRAILAYLASVIIHGLWNAFSAWEGINRIASSSSIDSFHFSQDSLLPLGMMGGLFLLMLSFLIFNNKILKD